MRIPLSRAPLSRTRHSRHLGRSLLAAGLLLAAAPWASAQATSRMADGVGTSYIGLNGGPSDFSRIGGGNGFFSRDDHNTAYSLSVGSYSISPNLGAELGYTNFGQANRGGGTTKAEGINLSLIGKLPLNPSFNLLGKLGTTYGHTDVSAQAGSGFATGSESGFDWSYGIGGELVINPQWSAVLQYDEHYLKFAGISSERVSTTTLGVRLHF